jgi:hypothetical protein
MPRSFVGKVDIVMFSGKSEMRVLEFSISFLCYGGVAIT